MLRVSPSKLKNAEQVAIQKGKLFSGAAALQTLYHYDLYHGSGGSQYDMQNLLQLQCPKAANTLEAFWRSWQMILDQQRIKVDTEALCEPLAQAVKNNEAFRKSRGNKWDGTPHEQRTYSKLARYIEASIMSWENRSMVHTRDEQIRSINKDNEGVAQTNTKFLAAVQEAPKGKGKGKGRGYAKGKGGGKGRGVYQGDYAKWDRPKGRGKGKGKSKNPYRNDRHEYSSLRPPTYQQHNETYRPAGQWYDKGFGKGRGKGKSKGKGKGQRYAEERQEPAILAFSDPVHAKGRGGKPKGQGKGGKRGPGQQVQPPPVAPAMAGSSTDPPSQWTKAQAKQILRLHQRNLPCASFQLTGRCRNGQNCPNRHQGVEQLGDKRIAALVRQWQNEAATSTS